MWKVVVVKLLASERKLRNNDNSKKLIYESFNFIKHSIIWSRIHFSYNCQHPSVMKWITNLILRFPFQSRCGGSNYGITSILTMSKHFLKAVEIHLQCLQCKFLMSHPNQSFPIALFMEGFFPKSPEISVQVSSID